MLNDGGAPSLTGVEGREVLRFTLSALKSAELGRDVTGLSEGQPVVVDMNIGCGRCYWCRRNEILNCPDMNQIGITMDGAFAEYIAVPARLVIPAPDHVPAEILALTEPLACVVRAARKSRAIVQVAVSIIMM